MNDVITIGGAITGRITYLRPNQINVEITSPYQGITSGRHIPYFSMRPGRKRFEEMTEKGAMITDYGIERAKEILQEIYDACHYIESNLASLKPECSRRWQEVLASHAGEDFLDKAAFTQEKKRIKAAWKAGDFDQQQYALKIQKLHQRLRRYEKMISEAESAIGDILYSRANIAGIDLVSQLIYKYELHKP
ncbi:MAG: hypothetical protein ACOX4Q_05725 [Syntrophomonadales bacterium]|jgi:hypothetical protein